MFERVKEIIVDALDVDESLVSINSTLEDLGADSLDAVELIMTLEEEFEITIDDTTAQNIKSVSDIIKILEK